MMMMINGAKQMCCLYNVMFTTVTNLGAVDKNASMPQRQAMYGRGGGVYGSQSSTQTVRPRR